MQSEINADILTQSNDTAAVIKKGMYYRYIKRPMDFTLALLAFIVLCPVMLIVALLVKIKLGSPVMFKQERPGLNEKIFIIYKFRTMTDEKDENGDLLPDNVRLTKFGEFLRTTSLDEIPELWNIIRGDMAIIGPRPLLTEYLTYYSEKEKHRHDVRPGLTGLAQVSGRNFLKWDERLEKDVEYVNSILFVNDLKILFKTIIIVFNKKTIAAITDAVEGNLADIRSGKNIRADAVN